MSNNEFLNTFDNCNAKLYSFVYSRVGFQKELAQDITQEAFIKMWNSKDNFEEGKASAKTWLFVIAKNLIIDYYRKQGKRLSADFETFAEITPSSYNPEVSVDLAHLHDCIKKLNKFDQEIIKLKYIEQLTAYEISVITNKTENAIKVAAHRALEKLKQIASE